MKNGSLNIAKGIMVPNLECFFGIMNTGVELE